MWAAHVCRRVHRPCHLGGAGGPWHTMAVAAVRPAIARGTANLPPGSATHERERPRRTSKPAQRNVANFADAVKIQEYGLGAVHKVTMERIVNFEVRNENREKKLLVSARFLHDTIPTRLARRLNDFHFLPYHAAINPNMHRVYDFYCKAFEQASSLRKVETLDDVKHVTHVWRKLLKEGNFVLPMLARGSKEIAAHVDRDHLTKFLNDFLTSRISRRLLLEQHIAMFEEWKAGSPLGNANRIGAIRLDCDPKDLVRRCFRTAAQLCEETYGVAPSMKLVQSGPEAPLFPYVERHVEYMLMELFKNATRAVVEHHTIRLQKSIMEDLPPVRVSVVDSGPEGTTIKVSDEGGGIPVRHQNKVFDYAFTTVGRPSSQAPQPTTHQGLMDGSVRPMAGEGFGLPLCRLYAEFFGGSLTMQHVRNVGTEVFLRLSHISPAAIDQLFQHDDNDE
eukprot:m.317513 g.317513  ORF g.317513 m.317513 type:complete len:449 (+) comp19688_c0_seq13:1194-2540(+)